MRFARFGYRKCANNLGTAYSQAALVSRINAEHV